jgi:flagellar hook-associated protein 3 FlgL
MRVSSSFYQSQWLAAIQRQQVELGVTQNQINTGRRIATAADDPAGIAYAVVLQQGIDRLTSFQANAETARRRLSLEENSLSQATDALSRLRELSLQAVNATQTNETRQAIAAEARELFNSLVNIGNAQDGEGRYLFAGNKVQTRPFASQATVTYLGDEGVRAQRIADGRDIQESDAGSRVFMQIPNGNGTYNVTTDATNQGTAAWQSATVSDPAAWVPDLYTVTFTAPNSWVVQDGGGAVVASGSYVDGGSISFRGVSIGFSGTPSANDRFTVQASEFQSVFQTAQDLIAAFGTDASNPAGRAVLASRVNTGLTNLDQALQHFGAIRSQIGARLATIDRQLENNTDTSLELTRTLSGIRDLDYAEAVSRLEQQLVSLEAAQKAYARTRSFSLFDVL